MLAAYKEVHETWKVISEDTEGTGCGHWESTLCHLWQGTVTEGGNLSP